MNFLLKNRKIMNIVLSISIILDVLIGFIINILSQNGFALFSWHNIVLCIILLLLVSALIFCNLLLRSGSSPIQRRRLQKAFQDNGGYEAVVDEIKICIKEHDYKSIKDLKRIVNLLEK